MLGNAPTGKALASIMFKFHLSLAKGRKKDLYQGEPP